MNTLGTAARKTGTLPLLLAPHSLPCPATPPGAPQLPPTQTRGRIFRSTSRPTAPSPRAGSAPGALGERSRPPATRRPRP